MKQCGCNPTLLPYEFPIPSCSCNCSNIDNLHLDIRDYYCELNDICELKQKIINDFQDVIDKLECGIQPDLEFLLLEISLVYIYNE